MMISSRAKLINKFSKIDCPRNDMTKIVHMKIVDGSSIQSRIFAAKSTDSMFRNSINWTQHLKRELGQNGHDEIG